jgi:hypothetical protein
MGKFEEEKSAHESKMIKMESEMKAVFQQKVAEKEAKLKQSEQEVCCFNLTIAFNIRVANTLTFSSSSFSVIRSSS